MEISPAAPPPRSDLTVAEGILPQRLYILPTYQTRTGTPLTFDRGGWRPIRVDQNEQAMFFAAGPCGGAENVMAFKAMIVDTHVASLDIGRVKIVNIQDSGVIQFVNDPAGPYIALTKSRVFLG